MLLGILQQLERLVQELGSWSVVSCLLSMAVDHLYGCHLQSNCRRRQVYLLEATWQLRRLLDRHWLRRWYRLSHWYLRQPTHWYVCTLQSLTAQSILSFDDLFICRRI